MRISFCGARFLMKRAAGKLNLIYMKTFEICILKRIYQFLKYSKNLVVMPDFNSFFFCGPRKEEYSKDYIALSTMILVLFVLTALHGSRKYYFYFTCTGNNGL